VAAINLASIKAEFGGLCLLSVILHLSFFSIRLSLIKTLKETRYLLYLMLFVLLSRTLFTPGETLVELFGIPLSRQGFISGSFFVWRLWLVLITGILLIHTSKTGDIKAAVQWYLKPFPFIPEKKVGVVISLMIRFLPFILQKARETSDAQKARGVENRKNPIYRLRVFVLPLLRSLFENADNLVVAMEARCYTENRTDPELRSNIYDWLITIVISFVCLASMQI